jgi:hypothetical protein
MKLRQLIEVDVYPQDLDGTYTWEEAKKACKALGDGWRLPTKEELDLIFQNKDKIGGFAVDSYWSLSENNSSLACVQRFSGNGNQYSYYKDYRYLVRPIRGFTNLTVGEGK